MEKVTRHFPIVLFLITFGILFLTESYFYSFFALAWAIALILNSASNDGTMKNVFKSKAYNDVMKKDID